MPVLRRKMPVGGPAKQPASVTSNGRHVAVLEPIITMDSGGVIQSASDSVEQIFGWTPKELFGKNVRALIPEPRRSDLDRYLDRYRDSSKAKTLQRTRCFDAVHKDGRIIQIELSVSRANLPANSAPFFIGIVRDVSQGMDVRADSSGEHIRLQSLFDERTRELVSSNLRLHLADRLTSLGTLAAGLGHDMNNVLLPVRARLDALENAGINPDALTHVTALRRAMAYLQHLSDGLHFLSGDPDASTDEDHARERTDLFTWWGQVGTLLCKALPSRVRVRVSIPTGLPSVKVGPHWLTQAVLNLLVNAGESMPPGRRDARVRIWAKADDRRRTVRFGVTDNGRGMTQAVKRRAFDLFFTTKARAMGTGLGLSLARRVATRAGGEIEIETTPDRGTTVTMVLPTAERTKLSKLTIRRSASVSGRDHRTVALVSQILLAAGLSVEHPKGGAPGTADVWVTQASPARLTTARRWLKGRPSRSLLLLGAAPARARPAWAALGAIVIESPDDFQSIRQGIDHCLAEPPKEDVHAASIKNQRVAGDSRTGPAERHALRTPRPPERRRRGGAPPRR